MTWSALGRPAATFGKRSRPAYTAALVGRAITMGLDPAGVRLGLGMPRYRLSHEDLADLVAYLEILGTELDPGISATTITLGTLLPSEQAASGLRQAIARTLRAYADDLNRRGGIYNRHVVLQFEDLEPSPGEAGGDVSAFLKRGKIFALLRPILRVERRRWCGPSATKGSPLIGPFAAASTPGGAGGRADLPHPPRDRGTGPRPGDCGPRAGDAAGPGDSRGRRPGVGPRGGCGGR